MGQVNNQVNNQRGAAIYGGTPSSVKYYAADTSRALPSEVRNGYFKSGALPSDISGGYSRLGPLTPGGPITYVPATSSSSMSSSPAPAAQGSDSAQPAADQLLRRGDDTVLVL